MKNQLTREQIARAIAGEDGRLTTIYGKVCTASRTVLEDLGKPCTNNQRIYHDLRETVAVVDELNTMLETGTPKQIANLTDAGITRDRLSIISETLIQQIED